MIAFSPIGQAPVPPPIPAGVHTTTHHAGTPPPVIDPYVRPAIDPFVLPVVEPFVLPVVEPFVLPAVYPYLPSVVEPAHLPPEPIPEVYHEPPRRDGPHWLFYVLLGLMAHFALVEKEF